MTKHPVASGTGLTRVARLTLTAPARAWDTLRSLTPAKQHVNNPGQTPMKDG